MSRTVLLAGFVSFLAAPAFAADAPPPLQTHAEGIAVPHEGAHASFGVSVTVIAPTPNSDPKP